MVFVTGDTHSDFSRFSSKKWRIGRWLTKNDVVIICGDFGGIWATDETLKYWNKEQRKLEWLNNKPWTTLFVDGNHENFGRLNSFPEIEKFGAPMGKISNSIFHLKRGNIYTIDDQTFFCFGGATSTDKQFRINRLSWWEEEIANKTEEDRGIDNLMNHNMRVDYVITHTAPKFLIPILTGEQSDRYNDPTAAYLESIHNSIRYKRWFFGHFHDDQHIDQFTLQHIDHFTLIYEKIILL